LETAANHVATLSVHAAKPVVPVIANVVTVSVDVAASVSRYAMSEVFEVDSDSQFYIDAFFQILSKLKNLCEGILLDMKF